MNRFISQHPAVHALQENVGKRAASLVQNATSISNPTMDAFTQAVQGQLNKVPAVAEGTHLVKETMQNFAKHPIVNDTVKFANPYLERAANPVSSLVKEFAGADAQKVVKTAARLTDYTPAVVPWIKKTMGEETANVVQAVKNTTTFSKGAASGAKAVGKAFATGAKAVGQAAPIAAATAALREHVPLQHLDRTTRVLENLHLDPGGGSKRRRRKRRTRKNRTRNHRSRRRH